jgi:hypothetical protein
MTSAGLLNVAYNMVLCEKELAVTSLPLLWVLLTTLAAGQDVSSGPKKGEAVPALKVFDVTGPHKDKDVDYTAERKDKLTVYAFVQADQWDRPMARFLRKLDEAVQEQDALVVAVWLTDDADKTKEYLPRAQQSLQLQATTLTCFTGDKAGPKGWGVNADARLTVVVADKHKVAATFGYHSVNETDVPTVRDALKKH